MWTSLHNLRGSNPHVAKGVKLLCRLTTFYTVDREDGDSEAHGSIPGLREYRARFLSGQLQDIVHVNEDSADHVRYGLASFRWFEPRSFMFGDPDETSDADKPDIEFGK